MKVVDNVLHAEKVMDGWLIFFKEFNKVMQIMLKLICLKNFHIRLKAILYVLLVMPQLGQFKD